LKGLARSYLTISKDLTRVMNRLKALYYSWGMACAGTQVRFDAQHLKLQAASLFSFLAKQTFVDGAVQQLSLPGSRRLPLPVRVDGRPGFLVTSN